MTNTAPFEPLNEKEIAASNLAEKAMDSDDNISEAAEREGKIAWIRRQVENSIPVDATPAAKYLTDQRGLHGPFPLSLRWSKNYQHAPDAISRPCMLSVVTNSKGEIVALQSTQLDPKTGAKACKTKPDRYTNGPASEGAVFLGVRGETTQTLVIGEGVETTLTRNLIGPCDGYACLGNLRYIQPEKHHKRVEILAENNNVAAARRLARQYTEQGIFAYVVTVPDSLGPKADLNDAVRELGISAVRMAVEDAEPVSASTRNSLKNFKLDIGSDIEIAQRIIERLEEIYGAIIVCDGAVWRFDRTHWIAFENDHLARFVHRADGAIYYDSAGNQRTVRLNKSRVSSILDAVLKYRQEHDYFKATPCGINCESGFIQISEDGTLEHLPHARRWRQRHVVLGHYQENIQPKNWESSNLVRYLRQAVSSDEDAVEKINLLGEVAGCTATGSGTKIRNPKAIIAFSEEGGTGKSTLLRLLRALPNIAAVASVPASKFGDEKYAYRLIGKVLNAADELPDRAIKSDVFKRMITGEPIPARDVYCSAIDFSPVALHVFSTNVLPGFSGGVDGGTARRLLPIEFSHVVPENERDPDLPDRIIREEADLLLYFAVEGACRLIRQKGFTIPASSKILLDRWLISADPVRAWAAERLEVTNYENIMAASSLYQDFQRWTERKGMKRDFLPNAISFGKRLPAAVQGLERHRSDGSHYRNVRLNTQEVL